MKTRNGFVSNSSSTSFVIVGWVTNHRTLKEAFKELFPMKFAELLKEDPDEEYIDDSICTSAEEGVNGIELITDGYSVYAGVQIGSSYR